MILFRRYIVILLSILCFSCGDDEPDDKPVNIPVGHVFEPVVTDMVSSSVISLPYGVSFDYAVINSLEELHNRIPSDIIASNPQYENIDYADSSLVSLKFRCFYKPEYIEYKISRDREGQVNAGQIIHFTEPLHVEGYFVMSNLVTEKIASDDKISLWQSFSCDTVTKHER